jgi:hypothetical protein
MNVNWREYKWIMDANEQEKMEEIRTLAPALLTKTWTSTNRANDQVISTKSKNRKSVIMHRLVTFLPRTLSADHISLSPTTSSHTPFHTKKKGILDSRLVTSATNR